MITQLPGRAGFYTASLESRKKSFVITEGYEEESSEVNQIVADDILIWLHLALLSYLIPFLHSLPGANNICQDKFILRPIHVLFATFILI